MFPGGLVGKLGELADELLEDGPHLGIVDRLGVQVDIRGLLGDEVKQAGLVELVDLGVEVETLENVPHRGRETPEVGAQVFPDVVLVAHEPLQVERRGVVKELARFLEEKGLGVQPGRLALLLFSKHVGLGGLEEAVEAAQHGEGQVRVNRHRACRKPGSSSRRYAWSTGISAPLHHFTFPSLSAFEITETELRLIAAPARIGLRRRPKNG